MYIYILLKKKTIYKYMIILSKVYYTDYKKFFCTKVDIKYYYSMQNKNSLINLKINSYNIIILKYVIRII